MNSELQEQAPLQPANGKMISPWKTNTSIRRDLLRLSDFVPLLLQVDRALGDLECVVAYNPHWWGNYIQLTASDEKHARKIVGKLIRSFKTKQTVKKVNDTEVVAEWIINGVAITVHGYKPKTCRYEEVTVLVPAQPERVETKTIAAVEEHLEKRRILVCDDIKDEPQLAQEVDESSEVPF